MAPRLVGAFYALIAGTFGLIVLGALVRANGAGLACPDWPLCFGEWVPALDVKIGFEWTHRLVALLVSATYVTLGIWTWRRPPLAPLRPWLVAGFLVLGLQIVLGGLTVLQLLAAWTVTSHLLVGNALNLMFLLTARRLADAQSPPPPAAAVPGWARAAAIAALGALALQVGLGGLVSSTYAGLACPEWPACLGGEWFPSFQGAQGTHLLHRLTGYALVAGLSLFAWTARSLPGLGPWALAACGLAWLQAGVGVANVLLRLPVEVTGLHSALAAALVLVLGVCLDEALWRPRRRQVLQQPR
ncbi:MAG: COX15/CtaA family protein [Proteobacteria bacterium]|nr:COX15/CtaA family protein [Pseudomonadota bacterium]